MQNARVNVNGQILSSEKAMISVFDRSYLYGDSLYEVARTYGGRFFFLKEHLDRLKASAQLCHMELGQTPQEYFDQIQRTFLDFRAQPGNAKKEVYMRLVVSRGVGKIGFGLSGLETSTQYTIIVQDVEAPTDDLRKNGMALQISHRIRNHPKALDPAMKSGNYLNCLLAYLEAKENSTSSFDDALLANSEGHITEGTTFNIFYVKRGILFTPPLDIGILDGITRRHVIQLALGLGMPVREIRFPKERLYEADEVFLTSSVREVLAVTRVDQTTIGSGKRGHWTHQLEKEYQKSIIKSLGHHLG